MGAGEAWPLTKVADAYEIVTSVHQDQSVRRAAAFVAATAHQILAREVAATEPAGQQALVNRDRVDPSVAAAILFLAAEQYADAHEASAAINVSGEENSYVSTILSEQIRDLARGDLKAVLERGQRWRRPVLDRGSVQDRATSALLEALATGIEMLAASLLSVPDAAAGRFENARHAFQKVVDLSSRSFAEGADSKGELTTSYPGPRHLAALC